MNPTRRNFLTSMAGALAAAPAGRPNIVFIVSDDQGYGDISWQVIRTPARGSVLGRL